MREYIFYVVILIAATSMGLVEFPKQCLGSTLDECYFGTVKISSYYKVDNLELYMGQETLLKRRAGEIEWVHGPVLFEVESKSTIRAKKHSISLQRGKYLFFGDEDHLKVDVLDGLLEMGRFQITEGFQGTFNIAGEDPELEPLQAIEFKEHLVRYVKVKKLDLEQAKKYADEFTIKHKNYLSWVEDLNKSLMKRAIAQEEARSRMERKMREKARLTLEKKKLEFFNKVFER